jgi:hypothetical protein
LELSAYAADAPKVIVASCGGEPSIDGKSSRTGKECQTGPSEAARIHRYRRRIDNEGAATAIPGGDVNTLMAGESTTRRSMNILRELAVAITAGGNTTSEGAPAPEAKALASTRDHSSARKADLPVVFAIARAGDAAKKRASAAASRTATRGCESLGI